MSRPHFVTIARSELDMLLAAARAYADDLASGLADRTYDDDFEPGGVAALQDLIAIWSA
jgi:hypothetical protein